MAEKIVGPDDDLDFFDEPEQDAGAGKKEAQADASMEMKRERFVKAVEETVLVSGRDLGNGVYALQDIPDKKRNNLAGVLAQKLNVDFKENVYVLCDATVFGSAKEGMLITDWGIRAYTSDKAWALSWKTIAEEFECKTAVVKKGKETTKKPVLWRKGTASLSDVYSSEPKQSDDLLYLSYICAKIKPECIQAIIEAGTEIFGSGKADMASLLADELALGSSAEADADMFMVCDEKDGNYPMVELLTEQIRAGNTYKPALKTLGGYEAEIDEDFGDAANAAKPVIFIGEAVFNHFFTEAGVHKKGWGDVKIRFNQYGMKYGWNKNKAVLMVEKGDWKDKDEREKLGALLGIETKSPNIVQKGLNKVDKLPLWAKIAGGAVAGVTFGLVGAAVAGGAALASALGSASEKDIFVLQQIWLVNKFLSEVFPQFIEGKSAEEQPVHAEPAAQNPPAGQYIFCDNCGNKLKATAKFCSACGTKVEAV